MTNSNERQLQNLAKSLPTLIFQMVKRDMKSLYESYHIVKKGRCCGGSCHFSSDKVREWKIQTSLEVSNEVTALMEKQELVLLMMWMMRSDPLSPCRAFVLNLVSLCWAHFNNVYDCPYKAVCLDKIVNG
ncbi:hypothetical protein HAX54_025385 [Datura stramonium]|uniref:Uncharacterized protein n=1 Tax=Datura stramonium TaxID=4076 RepID=A0ABS8UZK4_DATST|nr:hypothetical protein [Datura stramonium]